MKLPSNFLLYPFVMRLSNCTQNVEIAQPNQALQVEIKIVTAMVYSA
jgi:hypothetical protein